MSYEWPTLKWHGGKPYVRLVSLTTHPHKFSHFPDSGFAIRSQSSQMDWHLTFGQGLEKWIDPRECELPNHLFHFCWLSSDVQCYLLFRVNPWKIIQGPAVGGPINANRGLNFDLGFLLFRSKAFYRLIFFILYSASNHCIVGKNN